MSYPDFAQLFAAIASKVQDGTIEDPTYLKRVAQAEATEYPGRLPRMIEAIVTAVRYPGGVVHTPAEMALLEEADRRTPILPYLGRLVGLVPDLDVTQAHEVVTRSAIKRLERQVDMSAEAPTSQTIHISFRRREHR